MPSRGNEIGAAGCSPVRTLEAVGLLAKHDLELDVNGPGDLFTLDRMEVASTAGDDQRLRFDCATSIQMLHKIMQVANGIIHGTTHVMRQGEIDDYMGM